MNRTRFYVIAVVGAVLAACTTPTGVCGCTPARPTLLVRGLLQDRAGQPVPNVRIGLDAIPPNSPIHDALPVRGWRPLDTGGDGTFRILISSDYGQETLKLRLALLPGTTAEGPSVAEVLASFRLNGERADSVMRTFTLP